MAAHITAAAPGGPRFDESLTAAERKAAANGIWTCHNCGKLIDADESQHTVELLRRWKAEAERLAQMMLAAGESTITEPLELWIPEQDEPESVLSYASTAVTHVGRGSELDELQAFLAEDRPFSWWVWTGPAGAGKSRLAVELCRMVSDDWHAGFLPEAHQHALVGVHPLSPTLVVVDYAAQRSQWLSEALLDLARRTDGPPVRLLILERDTAGAWWDQLQRQHRLAEAKPINTAQYRLPRPLTGLDPAELRELIRALAAPLGATLSRTNVEDIAEHAQGLDSDSTPLSVVIATLDWLDSTGVSSGRNEALRRLIGRATSQLTNELTEPAASKVRRLSLLATSLGGLTFDRYTALLTATTPPPADLLPGQFELPASALHSALEGLQPDLLGELHILDQLGSPGVEQAAAREVLKQAASGVPDGFTAFVERAARDHVDHPQLLTLMDLVTAPLAWAQLAVDVIPLLRRSDHPVLPLIMQRLEALDSAGEPGAAELAVTARFRHANLVLFVDKDSGRANEMFTAALVAADATWAVHAGLLNNRGITWLGLDRPELAAADFTAVIDDPAVRDEARACALNNRADILEDSDLAAAIADRTAVLELTDTTYNRRYVALSRRARARRALGDRHGTYQDFETILQTGDIAVEQKMATRLERAEILLARGRRDEAVADLRIVVASARNFDYVEVAARHLLDGAEQP